MQEAAPKFSINRRIVTRIWAAAMKQQREGQYIHLTNGKAELRRKRVQIDLQLISTMELQKRATILSLARGIHCSKSTVGRWIQMGLIRAHISAIRSDLTAPNKLLRIRFSLEALQLDRILITLRFRSMHNIVHIDEKWFYISRGTHRFYLTPEEEESYRTCKSKKFITKVMFMCAVCRPLFTPDGAVLFDGKIGIFLFTRKVPAQRSSKNKAAGTIVTKPIDSVTKEIVRDCLINQVLPAIQQDNAKPYISNSDETWKEAANTDGFEFALVQQPPNSPDVNVNDLGWFRAIQSLQTEHVCHTVDELVNVVVNSFEQLSPTTLNNVFLSLQGCMVEIMKVKGQNYYRIPHMKKGALIGADTLPLNLEVSPQLVRECLLFLMENGSTKGIQTLMDTLCIHNLEGGETEEQSTVINTLGIHNEDGV